MRLFCEKEVFMTYRKKKALRDDAIEALSRRMAPVRMIRVDSRTQISVRPGESDQAAIERYYRYRSSVCSN